MAVPWRQQLPLMMLWELFLTMLELANILLNWSARVSPELIGAAPRQFPKLFFQFTKLVSRFSKLVSRFTKLVYVYCLLREFSLLNWGTCF